MGGCGEKQQASSSSQKAIPEYKVIVVGDSAVGKTAIIHSFINGTFADHKNHAPTLGAANQYKVCEVPGAKNNPLLPDRIKLDIWDTIGSNEYR